MNIHIYTNSVVWHDTGLVYFLVYKMDIEISAFLSIQEVPGIYEKLFRLNGSSKQSIQVFLHYTQGFLGSSPSWSYSLGTCHIVHILPLWLGNQTSPAHMFS